MIEISQKFLINREFNILNRISSDPDLKRVFIDQCNGWWGLIDPDGFMAYLKDEFCNVLVSKYNVDLGIREPIEAVKAKLRGIKDLKTAIRYINSLMKPKAIEKKKYGEVFTPLTLVEEMLDKLII